MGNSLRDMSSLPTPPAAASDDSEIAPPMQEDARKTGVHTGRRLREAMKHLPEDDAESAPVAPKLIKWAIRIVILAILVALLLLIFAS